MWDKESLRKVLRENFKDHLFVIVSNREPYLNTYGKNGKIKCERSIGGVSVIFDSVMRQTKGTWVAYGGSLADKETVDKKDHIQVPPNHPKYTLRRIWLNNKEKTGYYDGFSNESLWPLCHVVFIKPTFVESDWETYKNVNRKFAKAVLEEIGDKKALVWIQDYQLALVAQYIKEKRPDVFVAQFWHIPWPSSEIFRICPWGKEILTGLLHNNLLGFHRYYHVDNFLDSISRELEANINHEDLMITFGGSKIKIGAFPISIDYKEAKNEAMISRKNKNTVKKYIKGNYKYLAIGVDRLDYTKGIPNRLLAIKRFLEKYPSYIGKFVYLGIGAPSRTNLKTYKDLSKTIIELVGQINRKFQKGSWQPIYFYNLVVPHEDVLHLSNRANLCLVTPLDDGMNIFAKEYVAANKGDGAIILSHFIGAAKELTDAFLINPYDVEEMADTIKDALDCPLDERKERIKNMKKILEDRNLYRWAGKFLLEAAKIKSLKNNDLQEGAK